MKENECFGECEYTIDAFVKDGQECHFCRNGTFEVSGGKFLCNNCKSRGNMCEYVMLTYSPYYKPLENQAELDAHIAACVTKAKSVLCRQSKTKAEAAVGGQ